MWEVLGGWLECIGCIVLYDGGVLPCSQYIKCIPRDSVAHYRARRRAMAAMLGSTPPESPLGKALLGLT